MMLLLNNEVTRDFFCFVLLMEMKTKKRSILSKLANFNGQEMETFHISSKYLITNKSDTFLNMSHY